MKKIIYILVCFAFGTTGLKAQTTPGKINTVTNSAKINYNGTVVQAIPNAAAFSNQGVYDLTLNNPAGFTSAGTAYLNCWGTLTLTNGLFTTGGSLYLYGPISAGGGTIQPGSRIIGFYGTAAAQTIPNNVFADNTIGTLYIKNSLGVSSAGALSVPNTLSLQAGTFTLGGNLNIGGAIAYTSGGISAGNDTVTFNGSSSQTIPAGTFVSNSINNMFVDNPSGIATSSSLSIGNSLSITVLGASINPITITGTATLAGTLIINDFASPPTVGQQFTIISATAISGTFAGLNLPAGYTGSLSYASTTVKLTILGVPSGFKAMAVNATSTTAPLADIVSVKIYPNPTRGNCTIQSEKSMSDISVYNSMGQIVKKAANLNADHYTFNVGALMQGEYVFVITINGKQLSKNVLKVD